MTSNVLLISDTSDGQNWGCYETSKQLRALLSDSVYIRKTIFLNDIRDPPQIKVRPSLSDFQYFANELSEIPYSSSPFYKRLLHHGFRPFKHMFDTYPRVMRQFETKAESLLSSEVVTEYFLEPEKIDQVVINGEGSIHGNRLKSRVLLFFAYLWSMKLDKPTHIINHTLQIDTPELEKMVESVYPHLASVAFRDPKSTNEYLSKIGNTDNLIQAADAAWLSNKCLTPRDLNSLLHNQGLSMWHPNKTQIDFDFTDPYLCISGGSGFGHGGEDSKKIISIIESLLERGVNANLLLVAPAQHDEHILLPVAERVGIPLAKVNNNSAVGASVVGNSELYLGGRWHMTIFALLNETPIVNFKGNTFKMQSLKEMVKHDYPIFSPNEVEEKSEKIARAADSQLNEAKIHDLVNPDISSLQEKAKKNIKRIEEIE